MSQGDGEGGLISAGSKTPIGLITPLAIFDSVSVTKDEVRLGKVA